MDVREDQVPRRFHDHYALTKHLAEQKVFGAQEFGLEVLALRPRFVTGAGDASIFPRLMRMQAKGRLPQVTRYRSPALAYSLGALNEAACLLWPGRPQPTLSRTAVQAQLKVLNAELAALKSGQVDGGKLDGQLKSLSNDVATLKKQGNPNAAIESLEQDILVLKSQVDNRPTPTAGGASVQEFDAFRGQVWAWMDFVITASPRRWWPSSRDHDLGTASSGAEHHPGQ
ncbi:hypothetical protein WR25_26271 [Diploscapter pachys]|uniref:Uncharacterized protein n=1 Tax=Diploscapter pachys TaxID=2018661 RepID=A0A2A2KJK7_9BILA|nr:hypothetical protein WR25_26271 [Diploscapter pachys]